MTGRTYTQDQVDLVRMSGKVDSIEKTVNSMNIKLNENYVTKDQLKLLESKVELVQRIVYGVIGLILSTVVGGMVVFFINAPK